ncbi:MAG: hypothetical protein SWY16_18510, partial [Cyanobacteriota bacterium]|nr:hypothetical protein [Cyanobacteriota bacterium]
MWKKRRQQAIEWGIVVIATMGVTGTILGLRWAGVFQLSEWAVLDVFFRWRPLEPTDDRITIVGI